jgi:hypothetical protein
MSARRAERKASPLFEIARVLVRFDHVASAIVNADHSISERLRNLAWSIARARLS